MIQIATKKTLMKEKIENRKVIPVRVYHGSKTFNHDTQDSQIAEEQLIRVATPSWEESEGYYNVWNEFHELRNKLGVGSGKEIFNAEQKPPNSEIAALIARFLIDVTRRAEEQADYTSKFATEITNLNFPKAITLTEFLDYIGEFQTYSGANDSVPIIEGQTGSTDSVTLSTVALGWATTLENILYNPIHNLQKVTKAASMAYIDWRNSRTIGNIVGATFVASQQQAAIEEADNTYDMNVYMTVRYGVRKLLSLLDISTDRRISSSSGIKLLCNSIDAFDLQRVVSGQLVTRGTNGTINTANVQALPIDEIIVYDQGMTNGKSFKGKTLSYPGVTEGTFYLYIPMDYYTILTKRGLTLETGPGNVLQLSQENRAWYASGGLYNDPFFGSSASGYTGEGGYGAIIECTMPTDDADT